MTTNGHATDTEPTDLRLLTTAMADQFAERHPEVTLPCDERGEPI